MTLIKYGVIFMVFLIVLNYGASRLQNRQKDDGIIPENMPITEETVSMPVISVNEDGECIYDPNGGYGYRYGPSMLINDDDSIDAFFSRPGNNGFMWDYISYRHMDPDGTWGPEEIVLRPTSGSLDGHSVCDPGVIYFDGYYYIGYTGTVSSDGLANQVFVARSDEVNGVYEKWNGDGWGGNPKPIISYSGSYWGAGEISFVIENDELLCYYSWKDDSEDSMRCSKAKLSEDWPESIEMRCVSANKETFQCSSDVVYLDEYNMFLAFSIGNKMNENSNLLVQYSTDGREFEKLCEIDDVKEYAHNLGVSKHLDGHISLDDDLYIGYAYSNDNKWGRWKTYLQEISIDNFE